jgi:hypothetical protein
MKTLESELKEINSKLDPLFIQQTNLQQQIMVLVAEKKIVLNSIDLAYSKKISIDLKKITDEQWQWILQAGHSETETQYHYQSSILQKFGFFRQGFQQETNQVTVCIGSGKSEDDIKKMIEGFNYLVKYLKPVENQRYQGIRFEVYNDDDFSTLFVNKNMSISYFDKNEYSQMKKFENFELFIKWHVKQMKIKADKENDVDADIETDENYMY